jgi:hypothetical protein
LDQQTYSAGPSAAPAALAGAAPGAAAPSTWRQVQPLLVLLRPRAAWAAHAPRIYYYINQHLFH